MIEGALLLLAMGFFYSSPLCKNRWDEIEWSGCQLVGSKEPVKIVTAEKFKTMWITVLMLFLKKFFNSLTYRVSAGIISPCR
jgi:hypothetical protein